MWLACMSISGVPRQLVVIELIYSDKASDTAKMLLEFRNSCPVVSSVM